MQSRAAAEAVLVAVALGWGASFVVIKDVLETIPPHGLLAARFAVAALALAALFPAALRRIDGPTLRAGLALGAVLWVAFALQTVGLVHTTPAKSAFVTALYVPMTPILARLLLGAALAPRVLGAALLATVGLALLTHPGDLGAVDRGDVLTLGCAAAFALHIVLLDRLAGRFRARPLAVVQLAVPAVVSLGVALASEPLPARVPGSALGAVVYLGLVCSAFAYWAQTWAQRLTAPHRVAVIFALESVFAALLSVGLYGEILSPGEWLGGGLVVAAVLLGQTVPTTPREGDVAPGP